MSKSEAVEAPGEVGCADGVLGAGAVDAVALARKGGRGGRGIAKPC